MDFEEELSYYQGHGHVSGQVTQTYTTKIPPTYNGKTSWFAFEDAVLDWIDITELDEVKQGPALKNGLRDEAGGLRAWLQCSQEAAPTRRRFPGRSCRGTARI